MEGELTVRSLTWGDHCALADAWESAFIATGLVPVEARDRVRDVERWASDDEIDVLVAVHGDVVIGGVVLAPGGASVPSVAGDGEREVRMLGVLADARRLGAARALVTGCLEVALERRAPAVALWPRPQMSAAQRLYEQLGFKRTPERDFDLDGITMLTYRYSFAAQAT